MVPDTVTGVTGVSGSGGITITWDPQSGVAIYTLERRAGENGEWTPLPEVAGSTTTYTDQNRPAGTYYYRVAASNSYGPGPWSAPCEVTVKTANSNPDPDPNPNPDPDPDTPAVTPGTPAGLKITAQAQNSISLSWQAVSGAVGYRVYRSSISGGSYSLIQTTGSTSYNDNSGLAAGTTYYYRVTAYNAQGESDPATISGTTATVSGGGTIPLPPAKPAGLVISNAGSGYVSLSWNSVANAESYDIYRGNSKDGASARIGTGIGTTTYTDSTVGAGAMYYYSVRAVNSSGSSPDSNRAFAVAASHYTLPTYSSSQLTNISAGSKHYYRLAVTAGQGITITWQNGSSQNTDGNLRVSVWQNDGTAVFTDGAYYARGGYTDPLVFTAAAAGYVTVEVRNGHNSNSYNYQIYY
jgi:fibronectin type 3 domain-containing protein